MSKRVRLHTVRIRVTDIPSPRIRLFANQPTRTRVRIENDKYDSRTIIELEAKECRWPVRRSGVGTNEHLFCGRPCTKDGVYCDWHKGKAIDRRSTQAYIDPKKYHLPEVPQLRLR